MPAVISPYVLAAIGERYSRRYMLTAERFSAAEAYRIGLLHEIVPGEEQLDEAIAEILDSLLANGPQAQAECKTLIRVVAGQPIDEETIAETAQRITRVRASPEGQEGLAAFLEKRQPNWMPTEMPSTRGKNGSSLFVGQLADCRATATLPALSGAVKVKGARCLPRF
jgi:methylglutaconyl-CoA hydratase